MVIRLVVRVAIPISDLKEVDTMRDKVTQLLSKTCTEVKIDKTTKFT